MTVARSRPRARARGDRVAGGDVRGIAHDGAVAVDDRIAPVDGSSGADRVQGTRDLAHARRRAGVPLRPWPNGPAARGSRPSIGARPDRDGSGRAGGREMARRCRISSRLRSKATAARRPSSSERWERFSIRSEGWRSRRRWSSSAARRRSALAWPARRARPATAASRSKSSDPGWAKSARPRPKGSAPARPPRSRQSSHRTRARRR